MAEGAAIAIALIGTGAGLYENHKAQQAQKDADKAAQAQAELQNQRAIRQSIAASRVRQAETLAAGIASGAGTGSSGIQGGIGSAQTQQAANQGFANTTMAANKAINNSIQNYNQFTSNAALAGSLAALPGQFGFDVKSSTQKLFEGTAKKATGTP
jgi:hypothetical protein